MNEKDLIRALRGMTMASLPLVCLGCGHEHGCNVRGCAIIREAAARLERITGLPNDPLTLDELREMDGEPVWLKMLEPCAGCLSKWVVLSKDDIGWICDGLGKGIYGKRFVYYRRKPEEA